MKKKKKEIKLIIQMFTSANVPIVVDFYWTGGWVAVVHHIHYNVDLNLSS